MAITQVTSVGLKDGEIVNADLHSSAAIAGTKISPDFGSQTIATTGVTNLSAELRANGNIKITNAGPKITFIDSGHNPDYMIQDADGALIFNDITNAANRLVINTDGHVDVTGNLDVGAGVDVTGNITVTGTVDGVDIAARNTLFGGLTSSSGVLSNGVTATTQSASDNSTKVATTAYTDTAISNLIDSSPSTLNTLNELAAALGDDANFSTTVTNSIATKAVLTGSTNNQITTVTGANAIQGESNLMWDGSNLAIGHNTPDPNWKTKILVAANASYQGGLNITNGTNSDFNVSIKNSVTAIGNGTNNPLVFFTNGSSNERLRIDSNGKVLIGTATPQGNANADDLVISTSGTTGLTIRSGSTSHNGNIFFARGTSGVDEYRGWITYDHSQQHLTFGTNAQEIFRAFSGRFGIGTASPTRTLEVRGPSDSHLAITVPGTTQTSALLFGDSGDDDIGAISYIHSDNSMRFVTNTAERLRIQSDGNIGVGGTAPNYQLHCTSGIGIGGHGLSNQQLSLTNNAIQSLNLGVSYTSLLLNKDGGNVGIGVASAGNKLDVAGGNMKVSNTGSDVKVYTICNTSGYNQLCFGDTDDDDRGSLLYNHVNDKLTITCGTENKLDITPTTMSWFDGGSERMRFGTHGELGVCGAGSINYGSSGQVLTSGGSSAGMQWKSGGKIVQVVQHIRNDGWSESVSAGGKSSASLSDTITTTSNNNKVLVHVCATLGASGVINRASCILESNGTEISDAQSQNLGNNRHEVTASAPHENANQMTHISFTFLDSPGNAGSYTYSITHRHGSSSTKTLYMNQAGTESNHHYRFRAASFIVLQEVAA